MASADRSVLTDAQRAEFRGLVGSGTAPARRLTRARILLKADHGEGGPGWSDAAIVGALAVNPSTVLRVRRQVVKDGLTATLERTRPARVYARALDGTQEARLIAIACAATPEGADHWSLRLADELVRVEVVETISHATGRQTLTKTRSRHGWSRRGVSPRRPTPPSSGPWRTGWTALTVRAIRSVVGLDEPSRHVFGAVRAPRRAIPGHPARSDPASVRGGGVNLLLATEALRGWRTVLVRDQRPRRDCAGCITELGAVHDPQAERIVLVLDQLTTQAPAARSTALPPAEAKRRADTLEIHPPTHGSWLTRAERELRVLQRQCLTQRWEDRAAREREVTAGARRHDQIQRIHWHFTTADAHQAASTLSGV